MTDLESDITFSHAHIYLTPDEFPIGTGWREKSQGGKLDKPAGLFKLSINDFLLEMHEIEIPLSAIDKLSSDEAIIESAKRLVGDIKSPLEEYNALAATKAVQDNLYFTSLGLFDYSMAEEFNKKSMGEIVAEARCRSENPKEAFPNITLPKGSMVQFVPTFQALREINTLGPKSGDRYTIEGSTFAKSIENYLTMHQTVTTHLAWKEEAIIKRMRSRHRAGEQITHEPISVAELVFPNAEK